MSRKPEPIRKFRDFRIGRKYLNVVVTVDTKLFTQVVVRLSGVRHRRFEAKYYYMPWNPKIGWFQSTKNKWPFMPAFAQDWSFLKPGEYDNEHRIFRDTRRNRRILGAIVAAQDVAAYFALIGVHKEERNDKPPEDVIYTPRLSLT